MTPAQLARLAEIRSALKCQQSFGAPESDPISQKIRKEIADLEAIQAGEQSRAANGQLTTIVVRLFDCVSTIKFELEKNKKIDMTPVGVNLELMKDAVDELRKTLTGGK